MTTFKKDFTQLLSLHTPFAGGGNRACYIHPSDPSKVLKIIYDHKSASFKRKQTVWYKKLRPLYYFDDNLREHAAFKQLTKHAPDVWHYFPKCYGMIETDKGDAICHDLIRDSEGNVSLNLQEYLTQHGMTPELQHALHNFLNFLVKHRIITRDILPHNLAVQQADDGIHIYMFDGVGNSEFIPLTSILPFLGKKKVSRKIERFKCLLKERFNVSIRT